MRRTTWSHVRTFDTSSRMLVTILVTSNKKNYRLGNNRVEETSLNNRFCKRKIIDVKIIDTISPISIRDQRCIAGMDTRKNLNDVADRADIMNRHALRRNQETDNPCYKEHLLSLRCLDSNQEDRNACEPYFRNYKNCKTFWAEVKADRKSKGIKPHLPPLEERIKIKADFLNSK